MKATIDETGCLRVAAETPLESYALSAWAAAYFGPNGRGASTFVVEGVSGIRPQITGQQPPETGKEK